MALLSPVAGVVGVTPQRNTCSLAFQASKIRARARIRPAGGALDTTEVVHEAYLKLIDQSRVEWSDRSHFLALSARAMRHVLIDHYRRQRTGKRGGDHSEVTFEEGRIPIDDRGRTLLAVDEVLDQLAQKDERMAQVVTYRFYGGMTYEEIAEVTGRSVPTVKRDWKRARTWLYQAMMERDDDSELA